MEDEWTIDANEALTISLVEPSPEGNGLNKIASFHPKFTYPLFGEEERIFGHKDLKIKLQYDVSDLRPNLSISSSKKFASVGDVEATDVSGIMKDYLPGVAFQKSQDFQQAVRSLSDSWTPPGRLIKQLDKGDDVYEVWHGNLADMAVRQLVKRIQVVALLFIEGGSYIGVDADGNDEPESSLARWSIYFLYRKTSNPNGAGKRKYIFQGYSTVYHFWMFQQPSPPTTPIPNDSWELPRDDFDLTSLPHRARISQFVILPPFQKKGAGAFLYDTIFGRQIGDPSIQEVTVEDPNEAFDLLRDICDLRYLCKNEPDFANLKINPKVPVPEKGGILHNNTVVSLAWQSNVAGDKIVDIDVLEKLRVKHKIAPRQFSRLVEMHLMSQLPASVRPQVDSPESKTRASKEDKHVYTLWKLLLKQRIYRRNATLLGEFEITERILKLNETVENVEWEYANILEHLTPKPVASNGKRKLDEVGAEISPSGKKARVEDA
ncbi:histone acetyltransferase 1 [Diatrype stigma]|uniref:Histone acetyltransferase type B catalytic subunit n=1 Tax=Diatrype stigma TaxID=117547 RepID=A0AAN9USZ5_9PEZI